MKIQLTQGKFAVIDDDDCEKVSKYKWFAQKIGRTFYAVCDLRRKGGAYLYLHRYVLGVVDPTVLVDHADHDGLNNSKCNLRLCSKINNQRNQTKRVNGVSIYKGVGIHKSRYKDVLYLRWRARIKFNDKEIGLGMFPYTPCGELLAAVVYDQAAEKYYGEFASLNFK